MLEKDSELKSDSGALYKICHLMAKPARLLVSASEKWSRCSLPDYLAPAPAPGAGAPKYLVRTSSLQCASMWLLVQSLMFNVELVQVSGAEVSSGWCADDGSWCISIDCRPPMHQWHVIHLLQSSMLFTVQGKTYRTTEQCTRCAGAAPGGAPLHGWHLIHLISPCS